VFNADRYMQQLRILEDICRLL